MDALFALIDAIGNVLHQVLLKFYSLTGNFGLAIVILTLVVKVVLHPLARRQLKMARKIQALAPKVASLRERFQDDPQQLNREVIKLYREYGISPFGGFLSFLVQTPILAGLWPLLRRRNVFVPDAELAGETIRKLPPDDVSNISGADRLFGVPLDATPNFASILQHPGWVIIPLLVAFTTYWQQQLTAADPEQARMLVVVMSLALGYFAMQVPFGMSIYWIVSTVASVAENYLVVGSRGRSPFPEGPKVPKTPKFLQQRPRSARKKP